jgi:hypothetical protein
LEKNIAHSFFFLFLNDNQVGIAQSMLVTEPSYLYLSKAHTIPIKIEKERTSIRVINKAIARIISGETKL